MKESSTKSLEGRASQVQEYASKEKKLPDTVENLTKFLRDSPRLLEK